MMHLKIVAYVKENRKFLFTYKVIRTVPCVMSLKMFNHMFYPYAAV